MVINAEIYYYAEKITSFNLSNHAINKCKTVQSNSPYKYIVSITGGVTVSVTTKLFPLIYVSLIMIINYLNNINFILSHTILVTFSQYHKHYQYDKN